LLFADLVLVQLQYSIRVTQINTVLLLEIQIVNIFVYLVKRPVIHLR